MDEKPVDTDRASLVAQFRCEAEALNAEVFIVNGTDNLVKALNSFCQENGVDMLPAVLPETGIWPDVAQQLTRAGLTLINEFSREQLEESGVGLNAADFGIAETGTLVFLETAAAEVRTGTIPTKMSGLTRWRNWRPAEIFQSMRPKISTIPFGCRKSGR